MHSESKVQLSGEVGLAKPDPRIFELTIERCGLTPASTIYVDDVRSNVDAARQLGLNALHFENAQQLRSDLEQLRLL